MNRCFCEKSGNEIIKWTETDEDVQHLYFTSPSITNDNKYLIVISESNGIPNLLCIDRETKKVNQLTNSKGLLKSYTYPEGGLKGFSKASPFLDSSKNVVYWIEDNQVWKKGLDSSVKPVKLASLPKGWLTGYIHLSSDGKKICVPCTDPRAFNDNEDLTQHDQLKNVPFRMLENNCKSKLLIIDVETNQIENEVLLPFWVTHVQFQPDNSDVILCNSEGRVSSLAKRNYPYWGRIWLINVDGSYRRFFQQKDGEYINHENWNKLNNSVLYHGKNRLNQISLLIYYGMIFINKYIGQFYSRRKLDAFSKHFIAIRDINGKILYKINTDHPVSHAIFSPCSINFVADSRDGNIYGYRFEDKKYIRSLICGHSSTMKNQDVHPHPRISNDGFSVIFTSDREGKRSVYEVKLKNKI